MRSHICVVLSCGLNVRSYVFVFVLLSFLLLSLSMVISTSISVEVFFCLEIWKVTEEIIHLRLVLLCYTKINTAPYKYQSYKTVILLLNHTPLKIIEDFTNLLSQHLIYIHFTSVCWSSGLHFCIVPFSHPHLLYPFKVKINN